MTESTTTRKEGKKERRQTHRIGKTKGFFLKDSRNRNVSVHIYLLIGGLGVGPAIEVVDIIVSDSLSITEYLLAVHAQSLMV